MDITINSILRPTLLRPLLYYDHLFILTTSILHPHVYYDRLCITVYCVCVADAARFRNQRVSISRLTQIRQYTEQGAYNLLRIITARIQRMT